VATRAQQFEIFASGALYNGAVLSSGYAKFYAAGTTNTKNAYDDKDKGTSCTKKALDAQGRAEVYGDGTYKIELYEGDPDSGGTLRDTIDNYKCTAVVGNTVTVTDDYSADRDDAVVLVDTTSKSITISLDDVNNFDNPITIKKIHASNTVTIDPYSTQTVDGSATISMTENNDTRVLDPDTSADVWRRGDFLGGVTSTVAELNILDGVTATYSEINSAADGISGKTLSADSTAGRVLRMLRLYIDDAAANCNVEGVQIFNGDVIAAEGPLAKDASTTSFSLNAAGTELTVKAAALTGDCVGCIGVIDKIDDGAGSAYTVYTTPSSGAIKVYIFDTNGDAVDITSMVDTGDIGISLIYITDA